MYSVNGWLTFLFWACVEAGQGNIGYMVEQSCSHPDNLEKGGCGRDLSHIPHQWYTLPQWPTFH